MTEKIFKIGILTERMILGFGVDLVVHESAKRMQKKGHCVTVYTTRTSETYSDTSYSIINLKNQVINASDIFSGQFMAETINYLAHEDIDVWICETPPFYSWLPYLRPPVILLEHGTPPGKFFDRRLGKHLDSSTRDRFEIVYSKIRQGDTLTAISKYIRSCLPQSLQAKTEVVLNGCDHYPEADPRLSEKFREKLNIQPEDVMVLWVGRIDPLKDAQPYKGLSELLEIAPEIRSRNPAVKIVAVGRTDSPVEADLLLRKKNIQPVFNLPADEMPVAYRAADIFLNTSRWEGFNLPIAEAQFQGTPVVAYDLCAHPEITLPGKSAILVKSKEQIISAVLELSYDEEKRSRLSSKAKSNAGRFTWDTNVDKLLRIIESSYNLAVTSGTHSQKPAKISKNRYYYLTKTSELVHRYGWWVLIKEIFGWASRRIYPPR